MTRINPFNLFYSIIAYWMTINEANIDFIFIIFSISIISIGILIHFSGKKLGEQIIKIAPTVGAAAGLINAGFNIYNTITKDKNSGGGSDNSKDSNEGDDKSKDKSKNKNATSDKSPASQDNNTNTDAT